MASTHLHTWTAGRSSKSGPHPGCSAVSVCGGPHFGPSEMFSSAQFHPGPVDVACSALHADPRKMHPDLTQQNHLPDGEAINQLELLQFYPWAVGLGLWLGKWERQLALSPVTVRSAHQGLTMWLPGILRAQACGLQWAVSQALAGPCGLGPAGSQGTPWRLWCHHGARQATELRGPRRHPHHTTFHLSVGGLSMPSP